MKLTLNDGTDVELKEVWNCCEGASDCGGSVEVWESGGGDLLATIPGCLPDTDDEDFDLDEYVDAVSDAVDESAIM